MATGEAKQLLFYAENMVGRVKKVLFVTGMSNSSAMHKPRNLQRSQRYISHYLRFSVENVNRRGMKFEAIARMVL
jgi:hypothetical protein